MQKGQWCDPSHIRHVNQHIVQIRPLQQPIQGQWTLWDCPITSKIILSLLRTLQAFENHSKTLQKCSRKYCKYCKYRRHCKHHSCVDDWLWLQGQNQHKTTTKQIWRSPRKFSPNLGRTGEDVVWSEDGKCSAKWTVKCAKRLWNVREALEGFQWYGT